jgi:hypothetical protein
VLERCAFHRQHPRSSQAIGWPDRPGWRSHGSRRVGARDRR